MTSMESTVREYIGAWLRVDGSCLERLLSEDVCYTESYGPEYHGRGQVERWFADWNRRGRVVCWDITETVEQGDTLTVVWYFECDYDGVRNGFDGVSLFSFDADGRISRVREYQSKPEHVFPYEQ